MVNRPRGRALALASAMCRAVLAFGALVPFVVLVSPERAHAHGDPAEHAKHAPMIELRAGPPSAETASAAPRFEPPAPGSYELPPILQIAPHALLGVDGREEPLLALTRGELALVSFVYLQCGESCPLSTALLHDLDRRLAKDAALSRRVELVTVSFDPARDTPAAMAELRMRMAPQGRWRFLTAKDEKALRPVLAEFGQDAVFVPGGQNVPDALRHVLKVFLVDAGGAVRQIYSTGYLDARLVLADVRTLLLEAR
jgi:cytochrome oxidase Cu insertion factor (SCO1/SenC/PrrC family)